MRDLTGYQVIKSRTTLRRTTLLLVGLLIILGFSSMPLLIYVGSGAQQPQASAMPHPFSWGIGSLDYLRSASNMAINSSGYVYFIDTTSQMILVYNPAGNYLYGWEYKDPPVLTSPAGIAINSTGYVYITDFASHNVKVFTATGQYLYEWGSFGPDTGEIQEPGHIAINSSDDVYIIANDSRVQVFSPSGEFLYRIGSKGTAPGQIESPIEVAINSSGYLYESEGGGYTQVFDPAGNYLFQFNLGSYHIAINSSGNLYAGDGSVLIFDQVGNQIAQIPSAGCVAINDSDYVYVGINVFNPNNVFQYQIGHTAIEDGQFNQPRGIAVGTDGKIYVVDNSNHRVQVFDNTGHFLAKWNKSTGGSGSADGEFLYPNYIAVSETGFVYVTDTYNCRVQVFSTAGTHLFNINKTTGGIGSGDGEFSSPTGIAINSTGQVYVVDSYNHRVQVFSPAGGFLFKWNKTTGGSGSGEGEFFFPGGIAINSTGYVYVADTYNNRIQAFTASGQFVRAWGSLGSDYGQFHYPTDVAIAPTGIVYVTDAFNNRVQAFTSTGQFLYGWGSEGGGLDNLDKPIGLAINGTGHVFVGDSYNHRVQMFAGFLNSRPVIYASADISYPAGDTTAHEIIWTLTDPDTNNANYSVQHSGGVPASGAWVTGTKVTVDVAGLPQGEYTYILIAVDGYGESATSSVQVSVTAPDGGIPGYPLALLILGCVATIFILSRKHQETLK